MVFTLRVHTNHAPRRGVRNVKRIIYCYESYLLVVKWNANEKSKSSVAQFRRCTQFILCQLLQRRRRLTLWEKENTRNDFNLKSFVNFYYSCVHRPGVLVCQQLGGIQLNWFTNEASGNAHFNLGKSGTWRWLGVAPVRIRWDNHVARFLFALKW